MTLSASIHCCAFSVTRRRWSRGEKQGSKEQYGIWLIESKNGFNCVSCRHVCVGAGTSFAKTRTPPERLIGRPGGVSGTLHRWSKEGQRAPLSNACAAADVPAFVATIKPKPASDREPRRLFSQGPLSDFWTCPFRVEPRSPSDLLSARSPTLELQNRSGPGNKGPCLSLNAMECSDMDCDVA
jgi:hypothetical protein